MMRSTSRPMSQASTDVLPYDDREVLQTPMPATSTPPRSHQASEPIQQTSGRSSQMTRYAQRGQQPSPSGRQHGSPSSSSVRSYHSSNSHCSFCLVAEFDIDKGSTLSQQYPEATGHDEHMLAELMLPDGVHARTEDWTVFFLPKVPKSVIPSSLDNASTEEPQSQVQGREDLVYVLNLVRTKHDNSVRRGALVKAISIGLHHPFIHIFKPLLLLALDEYFELQSRDVLARLYESLNTLDLSLFPNFSREEKLILRAWERRDLFEERVVLSSRLTNSMKAAYTTFDSTATDDTIPNETNGSASEHVRNLSRGSSSMHSGDDLPKDPPRTGQVSHKPSLASLRPGNLKRRPSNAVQTPAALDPPSSSIRRPSNAALQTSTSAGRIKDSHFWETCLSFGKIQDLPIRVPTDVFDEEIGEYSLIHLITTFGSSIPMGPHHPHLHSNGHLTPSIILLFNAVVTGKRIIFLGHNQPSSQVALYVLSVCALGSGCGAAWRGIVRRCFPYANLGMLDELEQIPGYIAGVTNPRFEELRAWDVLCNTETGKITVAKDIEPIAPVRPTPVPSMPETFSSATLSSGIGHDGEARLTRAPSEPDISTGSISQAAVSTIRGRDRSATTIEARSDSADVTFMEEIMLAISARYGERYIRSRFTDYAFNFLRITARHEEYYYGHTSIGPASQPFLNGQLGSGIVFIDRDVELKEVGINAMRVEGWRSTESYRLYRQASVQAENLQDVESFDLGHQLARLRRSKKLPHNECELIFSTIAHQLHTHEQILELLASLPPHLGGLMPISAGLFHPSPSVSIAAQDILIRLIAHSTGRKFVQSLNLYHRLAFARAVHERQESMSTKDASGSGSTQANPLPARNNPLGPRAG